MKAHDDTPMSPREVPAFRPSREDPHVWYLSATGVVHRSGCRRTRDTSGMTPLPWARGKGSAEVEGIVATRIPFERCCDLCVGGD